MNWKLYRSSLSMNPNHIRYDIYSFIKLTASYFNVSKFHEDCMILRFNQTRPVHRELFTKTRYEDIIIGLLIFTNEYDCMNEPIDIEQYVRDLYKEEEYKKHIIAIYKVLQTLKTINNIT